MVVSQTLAARHVSRLRTPFWISHPVGGAPARAVLALGTLALLAATPRSSGSGSVGRRQFWWCRQRAWTPQLDPQLRSVTERRYKVLKHKHAEAMQRNQLWGREVIYRASRWRISSAWEERRAYSGRWVNFNQSEEQRGRQSSTHNTDKTSSNNPASEAAKEVPSPGAKGTDPGLPLNNLRRQLDEDPYRVLFGRRLERLDRSGSWSPHGLFKSISERLGTTPFAEDHVSRPTAHIGGRSPAESRSGPSPEARSPQGWSSNSSPYEFVPRESGTGSPSTSDFDIDPITLRKVPRAIGPARGANDAQNIPIKHSSRHFVGKGPSQFSTDSGFCSQAARPMTRAVPRSREARVSEADGKADESSSSRDIQSHGATPPPRQARRAGSRWLEKEDFVPAVDQEAGGMAASTATPTCRQPVSYSSTGALTTATRRSDEQAVPPSTRSEAADGNLDLLRPSDVRASAGIIQRSAAPTSVKRTGNDSKPARALQASESDQRRVEADGGSQESSGRTDMPLHPETSSPDVPASNEPSVSKEQPQNLTKQVREIYEQKYGTIDVNHRQRRASAQSLTIDEAKTAKGHSIASPSINRDPTPQAASSIVDNPLPDSEENPGASSYQIQPTKEAQGSSSTLRKEARVLNTSTSGSLPSSEEIARHWNEQENVLQEDVQEIEDFLKDIDSQLDTIAKERGRQVVRKTEPAMTPELSAADVASPSVYKILAFDPTTNDVSSATTTSSALPRTGYPPEEVLTPAQVIPQLGHPARFLTHIGRLQADGFEIVSGGGDVLVLKKVRDPVVVGVDQPRPKQAARPTAEATEDHVEPRSTSYPFVNPIDGTTTTGNFASPTGFVSYNTLLPSDITEQEREQLLSATKSSYLTEDHPLGRRATRSDDAPFGGAKKSRWHDESFGSRGTSESSSEKAKTRPGKVAGRMLVGGACVAACSFAISVVTEFFKTGGSTGAGIQGF